MPRTPSSSTRRRRPSTAPTQSGPAAPTASGIRRCAASASPAPVGRKPCFPSGIPYRRDPPRDSFGEEKKRPTPPRYPPRQYPMRAVPTTTYGEQQAAAEEQQANAVGGGFQPMGVRVAPVAEGFADIDLDRGGYDGRTPSVAPQPAAPSADAERYEKLSELYDTLNANNRHLRSIFARLPGSGFPPPGAARARAPREARRYARCSRATTPSASWTRRRIRCACSTRPSGICARPSARTVRSTRASRATRATPCASSCPKKTRRPSRCAVLLCELPSQGAILL